MQGLFLSTASAQAGQYDSGTANLFMLQYAKQAGSRGNTWFPDKPRLTRSRKVGNSNHPEFRVPDGTCCPQSVGCKACMHMMQGSLSVYATPSPLTSQTTVDKVDTELFNAFTLPAANTSPPAGWQASSSPVAAVLAQAGVEGLGKVQQICGKIPCMPQNRSSCCYHHAPEHVDNVSSSL